MTGSSAGCTKFDGEAPALMEEPACVWWRPPTDENRRPRGGPAAESGTMLKSDQDEIDRMQAFGVPNQPNQERQAARSSCKAHNVCAIAAQLTICRRRFLN